MATLAAVPPDDAQVEAVRSVLRERVVGPSAARVDAALAGAMSWEDALARLAFLEPDLTAAEQEALEDALRHVPDAEFPRREGGAEGGWLLCDYGSVVVHIFDRETRDYYDLDGLWSQADTLLRVE